MEIIAFICTVVLCAEKNQTLHKMTSIYAEAVTSLRQGNHELARAHLLRAAQTFARRAAELVDVCPPAAESALHMARELASKRAELVHMQHQQQEQQQQPHPHQQHQAAPRPSNAELLFGPKPAAAAAAGATVRPPTTTLLTFAKLKGREAIKEQLRVHVILPAVTGRPAGDAARPKARTIVLHGPPGCGKSELACATAGEIELETGFPCLYRRIGSGDIYSTWLGSSETRMRQLFADVQAARYAVVFFDEADCLLTNRSSNAGGSSGSTQTHAGVLSEVLTGLEDARNAHAVFVFATNYVDNLDKALLSRLTLQIEVSPPDAVERQALLADTVDIGADEEKLLVRAVLESDGMSFRTLADTISKARDRAIAHMWRDDASQFVAIVDGSGLIRPFNAATDDPACILPNIHHRRDIPTDKRFYFTKPPITAVLELLTMEDEAGERRRRPAKRRGGLAAGAQRDREDQTALPPPTPLPPVGQ